MKSDAKLERATRAAADTFMRYGYSRTTMGSIAQVAEMSRPALYLLFPSKEEAFAATVDYLTEQRAADVAAALTSVTTLFDRLYTFCDLWLVQVFDLKLGNPDAGDMDDLGFAAVRRAYARMQEMVAEILVDTVVGMSGTTAEALARNLVFAVRGLGSTATDVADMRAMVRLEIATLSAALQGDGARRPFPHLMREFGSCATRPSNTTPCC